MYQKCKGGLNLTSLGNRSFVLNGVNNNSAGLQSITGGSNCTSSGITAIAVGNDNNATSNSSIALGRNATSQHAGTMVFSANAGTTHESKGSEGFYARVPGAVTMPAGYYTSPLTGATTGFVFELDSSVTNVSASKNYVAGITHNNGVDNVGTISYFANNPANWSVEPGNVSHALDILASDFTITNGFQGPQGIDGTSGTSGANGPQGFVGAGFQGFQGIINQGFQGFQGFQGADRGFQGFRGFQNPSLGFQGKEETSNWYWFSGKLNVLPNEYSISVPQATNAAFPVTFTTVNFTGPFTYVPPNTITFTNSNPTRRYMVIVTLAYEELNGLDFTLRLFGGSYEHITKMITKNTSQSNSETVQTVTTIDSNFIGGNLIIRYNANRTRTLKIANYNIAIYEAMPIPWNFILNFNGVT